MAKPNQTLITDLLLMQCRLRAQRERTRQYIAQVHVVRQAQCVHDVRTIDAEFSVEIPNALRLDVYA